MYICRTIDNSLREWSDDPCHKPLLLRGARQIGKTTAIRHLGESFKSFVEINLEKTPSIGNVFNGDMKMDRIIPELESATGQPIIPGKTLLFLDEIQSCPKAISALRYFYEDRPELHVVATGSLLEFAFEDVSDFGVGRIRNMFMYPFSFAEFVTAMGGGIILEHARKATFDKPFFETGHEKMLEYLKAFMIVGGMPAAVATYARTKSYLSAQQQQRDILTSLKADFDKYKTKIAPDAIRATFTAVIRQTCAKFNFSEESSLVSHRQAKACTALLERARIISRISGVYANGIPLGGDVNPKQSKFILLDTGLYLCESGLDVSTWILDPPVKFVNRGRLAEMFTALELLKGASPLDDARLFYWHREARNANAEVDFVVQFRNRILPVEVKSGKSGSMASLRILMKEKRLPLAVRTSEENFSTVDGVIRIIPLYMIGEYDRILRSAGDGGETLQCAKDPSGRA